MQSPVAVVLRSAGVAITDKLGAPFEPILCLNPRKPDRNRMVSVGVPRGA